VGGSKICTDVCCSQGDCPSGYSCSFDGNDTPGFYMGYDTAPICRPQTGAHDRPPGALCAANDECESGFCDRLLNLCISPCCHDGTCPNGTSCEQADMEIVAGHATRGRVCLNATPAESLSPL
jgi:hypothetical protein